MRKPKQDRSVDAALSEVVDYLLDVGRQAFVLRGDDREIAFSVYTKIVGTPIIDSVSFFGLLDYCAQNYSPRTPISIVSKNSKFNKKMKKKKPALEIVSAAYDSDKNLRGIGLAKSVLRSAKLPEHKSRKLLKTLVIMNSLDKNNNEAGNYWCQKMSLLGLIVKRNLRSGNMKNKSERGFSLIELLLVVVIIGIIAAIAVPALQKSVTAAENGSAFSTMRAINSTQVNFYSQNSRFGRLTEINTMMGGGIGTVVIDRIVRGKFIFEMAPLVPMDDELKNEYKIVAKRAVPGEPTYQYEMNQTGTIIQVYP